MNPPKIDRAIGALRERFCRETGVQSAILYGSSARGSAREESDIDILVLVSGGRIEKLRNAVHDVESTFDVNVSAMVLEAGEVGRLDRQFLDSVLRDGVPLAGEMPAVSVQDLRLRPIRIVSFEVSHLPPSEKMRLYRALDGYATVRRRGRKRYERKVKGLLDEVGGWRLGRGAVVIPETAVPRLEEILSRMKAKRWTIAAWSQAL
jgi:predicted nucleotidyltransferase